MSVKRKELSSGILYYTSSILFGNAKRDLRIYYYKLKTNNMLTVIGEKKGNEIVPDNEFKGYSAVFKSAGEDLKIEDMIKLLSSEGHTLYVVLLVIGIIGLLGSIAGAVCGFMIE